MSGRTVRTTAPSLSSAGGCETSSARKPPASTRKQTIAASRGESVTYEWQTSGPDGPHRFRIFLTPLQDEEGEVTGLTAAWRNLAECGPTRAIDPLFHEQLLLAFNFAPMGMALVGKDFRLLRVNRAFCTMLGYPEAELVGCFFAEFTHPEDVDTNLELAARLFHGEIPSYKLEKRFLTQAGDILWGEVTVTVFRDVCGEIRCGLGLLENITPRKEAEAAREALIRELQNALSEVKRLQGILPMCMYCKKIRDDADFWQSVESYITAHSEARFSHGICPDCYDHAQRTFSASAPDDEVKG